MTGHHDKIHHHDHDDTVASYPFPATTKQAAGMVKGVLTDVMLIKFSDKILVTISQRGRLVHWLRVSLANTNPGTDGFHTLPDESVDGLLPMPGLTATSLLGGYGPSQEAMGQLYARQIASVIAMKAPDEKRVLMVGLGLNTLEPDRDVFFAIVDLVMQCI